MSGQGVSGAARGRKGLMGDPMPATVEPMLATIGGLPSDASAWALELKWDGVRAITRLSSGEVRATGRRGVPVHDRYPELAALSGLLPGQDAVLDGEIVAFDEAAPSFERLQR